MHPRNTRRTPGARGSISPRKQPGLRLRGPYPATYVPPAGSTPGGGLSPPNGRARRENLIRGKRHGVAGSTPRQPRLSRFKKVIIELYSKHNEDHMIADPVNWKVRHRAPGPEAQPPPRHTHLLGTHTSALSAARHPCRARAPRGPQRPGQTHRSPVSARPESLMSPQSSLPPMVRPAADFSSSR